MGTFNNELYFQAHVDSLQIARMKAGVDIFALTLIINNVSK